MSWCALMLWMKSMLCLYGFSSQLVDTERKLAATPPLRRRESRLHPLLVEQEMAVPLPAAEERPGVPVGCNWFHLLPSKADPVVSQDVVDPARHGLVTVAGHSAALFRVLHVHSAVRSATQIKRIKK